MTEAARWYARVIEHVEGKEKITQLRNAARCFQEADFPADAAKLYQELARLVDGDERIECQLLATALYTRSGRFAMVRDQLQVLAKTLRLPRPKPPWLSRIAVTLSGLRLALREKWSGDADLAAERRLIDRVREDRYQSHRLRLCVSLARPMSMFDNLYATELNIAGAVLSLQYGDQLDRIHTQVGKSVFACYDKGINRTRGEATLLKLRPLVAELKSARINGDLWSGIAYSHALACRWEEVPQPVTISVEHYETSTDSNRFELAHTRWLDLWANWNLGRWSALTRLSDAMFDDATRRNDLFQQLVTTGGFGGAAWLVRDKIDELTRIRAKISDYHCNPRQTQVFHVFDWIASIQSSLYVGEYADAWSKYEQMEPKLRSMPYSRMQMIRVVGHSLGALAALHNVYVQGFQQWATRTRKLTARLRQEQIGYARVMADLYEGLLEYRTANGSRPAIAGAVELLQAARSGGEQDRLRPFQLAAEDALAVVDIGQSLGRLQGRMRDQHVARPARLARLYTVIED